MVCRFAGEESRSREESRPMGKRWGVGAVGLAVLGAVMLAPTANAESINELLSTTPEARERPIVSGLEDQGFGYLDYELVSMAWDRTCSTFGGAHGASDIAVIDAKNELLGLRFTPAEADAMLGIALKVHGSTGIESCP